MTEHPPHPPRLPAAPEDARPHGGGRPPDGRSDGPADGPADGEVCDYCGSTALEWRKCKLVCRACAQINKSCADL